MIFSVIRTKKYPEELRASPARSLQDCRQVPPSHRARSLSLFLLPYYVKKTKWTLLVRISSLHWPSVFTVNVAKNEKCQGCQQSQQKTVSEETRICIFLIFFNWAPWTCVRTALRFYPVLYQSLMNYSVDQMKLTK